MKVAFIIIGNENHFHSLVLTKYTEPVWHVVCDKDEPVKKDEYYRRANAAAKIAAQHYLVYIICNDHPVLTAMVISKVHQVRKSYRILEKIGENQFRALKIP